MACIWLACAVLLWGVMHLHVVALCLPANWPMAVTGQRLPLDMIQQLGGPMPTLQELHELRHAVTLCDSTDSVFNLLQKHWPALHEHVQACFTQPADSLPPSLDQAMDLQHPLQQIQHPAQSQQPQRLHQHQQTHSADSQMASSPPMPNLVTAPCFANSNALEQKQQQDEHTVQAAMGPQGCTSHAEGAHQGLQSQTPAFGEGLLASLGLQQLWEHFQHDTQVIQQQLDNGAKISGQSCKSCLSPHLLRPQREVLFEVMALLLMGMICTTALLLAAKLYKRRQSFWRHQQSNIAAHRLRQLGKLQLQQQQQQQQQQQPEQPPQQQQVTSPQQKPLSQLKQHCCPGRRHERQKSHASVVPSSPSASSCHSEVIGTAVSGRSKSGKKSSRARLAQRDQASPQHGFSNGRQLDRSHSGFSADCQPHPNSLEVSHCSVHSLADSLHDSTADAAFNGISEPGTPSSTAGSSASFFSRSTSSHKQSPDSPSLSTAPGHPPKPSPKRKHSKHHRRQGNKAPQEKRRFIPGLDQEFDAAVHELPTPLPAAASAPKPHSKAAEGPVGSSTPSSSSPAAVPQPRQASHPRRRLSVNAAPFVPSGYAYGSCIGATLCPDSLAGFPLSYAPLPEDPHSYRPPLSVTPAPTSPQTPFPPQSSLPSAAPSCSPYSSQTENWASASMWGGCKQGWGFTPPPPQAQSPPVPRLSPTSVLPWTLQADGPPRTPDWSFTPTCPALPGSVSTSGGVLLPPVLEEDASGPFPGIRCSDSAPLQATSSHMPAPLHTFDAPSKPSSALLDLPRHLPVTSGRLPGFNSIWSTTALPTLGLDSSNHWSSGNINVSSSIW